VTIDDYLSANPHRETGEVLRALLDASLRHATGRVYHGHPIWLVDNTMVAGFKTYPKHVTFMLWQGQDITDPTGRLQPGARRMASVKLASVADVDEVAFAAWLTQV
jgi:hypothetical protein